MSAEEYMSSCDNPVARVLVDREEITNLRDVDDRLRNILGMKEQVVENLRTELLGLYDDGIFSYTKAVRKDKIKGQLGQLEYDVKLLKGILTGD